MAVKSKKPLLPTELAADAATPAAALGPIFPAMSLESFADLGRDNLAAMTRANQVWSEGMQTMSQEILGFAQLSMTSAANAASALLSAKTLDEVVELSSAHARSSFETLAMRSAKLSELGVSIAGDVLAPFMARAAASVNS
jgi:hypothetical protein